MNAIIRTIRDSHDTSGGVALRRLVWSLWNQHLSLNLWTAVSSLNTAERNEFADILRRPVEGRDEALRTILTESGEFDRYDHHENQDLR